MFPVDDLIDVWRLLFCREFDKLSENLQYADDDVDWLRKEIKPIYSSNVQGLLRTKIEAGENNVAGVAGLPKLCLFLCLCCHTSVCLSVPLAQKNKLWTLHNTNRKPHTGRQTHCLASLCGQQKWPERP